MHRQGISLAIRIGIGHIDLDRTRLKVRKIELCWKILCFWAAQIHGIQLRRITRLQTTQN